VGTQDQIIKTRDLLADHEAKYRSSAMRWKFSYRALLVASALFSSSAAVVGKLEYYKFDCASDIASILAATAAVFTTLIAALDFEVNSRINRRSRHEVGVLLLEVEKSTANPDVLLSSLQEVIKRRSDELSKPD
jgi:hypothetical protein